MSSTNTLDVYYNNKWYAVADTLKEINFTEYEWGNLQKRISGYQKINSGTKSMMVKFIKIGVVAKKLKITKTKIYDLIVKKYHNVSVIWKNGYLYITLNIFDHFE